MTGAAGASAQTVSVAVRQLSVAIALSHLATVGCAALTLDCATNVVAAAFEFRAADGTLSSEQLIVTRGAASNRTTPQSGADWSRWRRQPLAQPFCVAPQIGLPPWLLTPNNSSSPPPRGLLTIFGVDVWENSTVAYDWGQTLYLARACTDASRWLLYRFTLTDATDATAVRTSVVLFATEADFQRSALAPVMAAAAAPGNQYAWLSQVECADLARMPPPTTGSSSRFPVVRSSDPIGSDRADEAPTPSPLINQVPTATALIEPMPTTTALIEPAPTTEAPPSTGPAAGPAPSLTPEMESWSPASPALANFSAFLGSMVPVAIIGVVCFASLMIMKRCCCSPRCCDCDCCPF